MASFKERFHDQKAKRKLEASDSGRSASKPTTPLNMLRGTIGVKDNAKPLKVALHAIKKSASPEFFAQAYLLASTSPSFSQAIPAARRVSNPGAIGAGSTIPPTSLEREVLWASNVCFFFSTVIQNFINLRTRIISAIERDDLEAALLEIDELEVMCGPSIWALENRIALLALLKGFEAQQKYVREVVSNHSRTNFAFFAHHFGERNEARMTLAAFSEKLLEKAKSWRLEDGHLKYLRYRLLDELPSRPEEMASIIAYESKSSPIDFYETLLLILQSQAELLSDDRLHSLLKEISPKIDDARLCLLLGEDLAATNVRQTADLDYYENYLKGDLQGAADRIVELEHKKEANLHAILVSALINSKSAINYEPEGVLAKAIFPLYRDVVRGSLGISAAADALMKAAVNLRHFELGPYIQLPLAERSYEGLISHRLKLSPKTPLGALMTSVNSEHSGGYSEIGFAQTHPSAWRFSLMQSGQESLANATDAPLSDSALRMAKLRQACVSKSVAQVVQLAEQSQSEGSWEQCFESLSIAAQLLLEAGDFENALQTSIDLLVVNPELLNFTPLIKIISARTSLEFANLRGTPCLPIAFHIFDKANQGEEKSVPRQVSLKRYLEAIGVNMPSQIPLDPDDLSAELVFLLGEVCVQETMELGFPFNSALELDKERMAICANLSRVSPDSRQRYDQEIVALTRRINIEEGVRYLESSRLFVDQIGIESWARRTLTTDFLRYLDFQKAGLFAEVTELAAGVKKAAANWTDGAIDDYLKGYNTTSEQLLEEIVSRMSNAFLGLPRYGLDAFLSSRVRHGSFVGYIRGPLEKIGLVTKRQSQGSRYKENNFKLDSWDIAAPQERRQANVILGKFSARIDNSLEEAVSKYLHVESANHPLGMIGYKSDRTVEQTRRLWVLSLKATLEERTTLDQILGFATENIFWPSIKSSLVDLQAYLYGPFKSELLQAINDMSAQMIPLLDESKRGGLLRDVNSAEREIADAIERVSHWFNATTDQNYNLNMTVEDAVQIGLKSTQNARPHFDPSVVWDFAPSTNILLGIHAVGMVNDVSFLIFENVSKHSGFEDSGRRPSIEVRATETDDKLIRVVFTSEIIDATHLAQAVANVQSAKEIIARGPTAVLEAISKRTTGTGLLRLQAVADSEIEKNPIDAVSFHVDEAFMRFVVSYTFSLGVISKPKSQ